MIFMGISTVEWGSILQTCLHMADSVDEDNENLEKGVEQPTDEGIWF